MALAIETIELTKDYAVGFWRKRPRRVLDGLSLQVEAGEVFGFLGPNGAGKTTTLKLLLQLVFPTSGDARVLGRPPGDLAAKRRLGYLPENPYFYDYLTAEELLNYFGGLLGLRGPGRAKRVSSLLDEVGIGADRRQGRGIHVEPIARSHVASTAKPRGDPSSSRIQVADRRFPRNRYNGPRSDPGPLCFPHLDADCGPF